MTTNPLGTDPIGKLLLRFSVPTMLTLIVNSLYNMVDQIFIGNALGVDGVAATNVAFPLCLIAAALALLIGDGCSANISLALGRGDTEKANGYFSQGLMLLLGASLVLVGITALFLEPLMLFFGASVRVLDLSKSYTGILLIGLPFSMANMALAAIIRADGNPKYMMMTMIVGSAINLILDPILIFGLDMGVIGAALATILGQVVAGVLALRHIPDMEHIHWKREQSKLQLPVVQQILALGISSFCVQMATAATQITMNYMMKTYGALSVYGSEITLSAFGILTKLYQISHAMFVGVSAGTQPINGYNFGAKQYKRVKETYLLATGISLLVSLVWYLVFRFGGGIIGGIFVPDDTAYLEFTKYLFATYMATFFIYGPPQVTSSFFQAIGKPKKALLMGLSRQVIFLIPLAWCLSGKFGLSGAIWSAPIADVLACILAVSLMWMEFAKWHKDGWLDQ